MSRISIHRLHRLLHTICVVCGIKTRLILGINMDYGLISSDSRRSVGRLHTIHLVIGGDDQLVQRLAVDAERRGTDTDADARRAIPSDRERELRDRSLDARAELLDLSAHHFLDQRDELIATVTREEIILAQLPLDQMGDFAEHLVAGLMTVAVVNVLELVEVEHDDLERPIGATRTRRFFFKPQREITSVW